MRRKGTKRRASTCIAELCPFDNELRTLQHKKNPSKLAGHEGFRNKISMTKTNDLRSKAKIVLSDWLNNQDWDLWTTLSTGYELTLPASRRAMIRFHDTVSKKNPCSTFWASEKFDVKDGFHIHTLWKFENNISKRETYREFVKDWRITCNTKDANIYSKRYNMDMGAHKYISKYITKEITDYDYFDSSLISKETINNNIQKFNEIGRNISAKKKIEKLCKQYGVEYKDVKSDYYKEIMDNKIWYEDINKIESKIYGK